jgi:hypothetical protein
MRIREAQKQMDLTDPEPDPQHCELSGGVAFVGMTLFSQAHLCLGSPLFSSSASRSFAVTLEGRRCEGGAQNNELSRGSAELVQHFRLQGEFTSAQERCLTLN